MIGLVVRLIYLFGLFLICYYWLKFGSQYIFIAVVRHYIKRLLVFCYLSLYLILYKPII